MSRNNRPIATRVAGVDYQSGGRVHLLVERLVYWRLLSFWRSEITLASIFKYSIVKKIMKDIIPTPIIKYNIDMNLQLKCVLQEYFYG